MAGSRTDVPAEGTKGPYARAIAEFESYAGKPWFERLMTTITAGAGTIMVAETAIRSVLVFSLPSEKVLLVAPFVQYAAAGAIVLFAFHLMREVRRNRESSTDAAR